MHRESEPNLPLERLSALMDGEADELATHQACCGWRDDEEARRQWHAWHVIGDTLRSDDLACGRGRDAAFLMTLRSRLASEPIVFAPSAVEDRSAFGVVSHGARVPPPVAGRRLRRSAAGAAAVAAGFVVVAGTLVALRPTPQDSAPSVARNTAAAPAVAVASARAVEPQSLVANGQLIRDARLDQYLAAHKQYSPLGMPTALTQGRLVEATAGSR